MIKFKMESPIEELFLNGFVAYCRDHDFVLDGITGVDNFLCATDSTKSKLFLHAQCKFGRYRTDFCLNIAIYDSKAKYFVGRSEIIIECDGFRFHHGNAKRAANDKKRDRILTKHCDSIVRFTGTELNKDPNRCAKEAIEIGFLKVRHVNSRKTIPHRANC